MPRAKQSNPANNRRDLLTPAAPGRVLTQPDQEYGKRTAQEQSQKILPVGPQPTATPSPAPTAPAAPVAPPGQPQGPQPGELPWMDHPGPGGPPTTGLPNSAGPGPEVLSGMGAQWHAQQMSEQGTLQSLLSHLASQPNSSSIVKTLASAAGKS